MKKTLLTLALASFLLVSCTKEEDSPIVNLPPKGFVVTVDSKELKSKIMLSNLSKGQKVVPATKNYDYEVSWTESVDPEGGAVTYDIEIGGVTVATGQSSLKYTLKENQLVANSEAQTVKVIAKDLQQATTIVSKEFTKIVPVVQDSEEIKEIKEELGLMH